MAFVIPAASATWYCRLPCLSRSQRRALPRAVKIGMRGNVPFPELSGKRKLFASSDLHREKLFPFSEQLSGKRKLFASSDLHREKLFPFSELLCLTARYVPR